MANTKQQEKICKGCTIPKPRESYRIYLSGSKAGQLASAYCVECINKNKAIKRGTELDDYTLTSEHRCGRVICRYLSDVRQ